jgi:two-component system, NarL family, nitrate/nitrite response regulator NarL
MLKILIIDDQILFREGLANMLHAEGEMRVIGEASSIHQAMEKLKTLDPDMALINSELTDLDDFHSIRLLRARRPHMQIILLSREISQSRFLDAMRNGARGYIPVNNSSANLLTSIHAIARGEAVIPRALVGLLIDELTRLSPAVEQEEMCLLTPREIEVLRELGKGGSNQQIAQSLDIAENTVKVHVHNILEKLNLPNRRQAARYARTQGISSLDLQYRMAFFG